MARILRTLLTDDVLARIHERAPVHDRDNTFPHDDLADLVGVGYLTAFVPERLAVRGSRSRRSRASRYGSRRRHRRPRWR